MKYPKYIKTYDGYIGTFSYLDFGEFPVYRFKNGERIADDWEDEYIGYCDICGTETEPCKTWNECKALISREGWKIKLDRKSRNFVYVCPECATLEEE